MKKQLLLLSFAFLLLMAGCGQVNQESSAKEPIKDVPKEKVEIKVDNNTNVEIVKTGEVKWWEGEDASQDEKYLEVSRNTMKKFFSLYLVDTDEQYTQYLENTFWNPEAYREALKEYVKPENYQKAEIELSSEHVHATPEGKIVEYTVDYEIFVMDKNNKRLSVEKEDNLLIQLERNDADEYKISNVGPGMDY